MRIKPKYSISLLLSLLLLLLLASTCSKKESFHIHGDLRCINATTAYLCRMCEHGDLIVLDSTEIHGGEFNFKGKVKHPTMYHIQIGKRAPIDVLVENSDIWIKGSALLPDEIKITGSSSNNDLVYLQKELKKIQNNRNTTLIELENARKQKNNKQVKALEHRYNNSLDSILPITKQFVSNNTSSVGAAYFICTLTHKFEMDRLKDIIDLFDISIHDSEYLRFLNGELALNQKLNVDSQAPDFELPSSTGDTVRLSDYSGKYLIIEFWASWCKNSATRNKELKKLYDRYHEAGLEILSISLDKEEEEWMCAIERDSMQWRQASDLLYWESPVSKYYRVQKIPYEVLISPDGKIVAVNVNSRKYIMDAKMRNIFGF